MNDHDKAVMEASDLDLVYWALVNSGQLEAAEILGSLMQAREDLRSIHAQEQAEHHVKLDEEAGR